MTVMIYYSDRKYLIRWAVMALGLFLFGLKGYAQQPPPRPISVYFNPGLGLRFGAFFQSTSGGTINVSSSGVRTSTGTVVLADMGYAYGAANFQILANPGTVISILNGPDVTLTGSSGGSLTLHIGTSSPASPFITTASPPSQTSVNIGGTLTVGSPVANPSGSYVGSFYVTFMQQ
jgi:uncharacterized protein DUF4402